MAAYDKKDGTTDSAIVEIRERHSHAHEQWADIRKEAKTDMLCVAGRPWEAMDPNGAAQRDKANRPMITSDELGQYINQVVNDVRANPRSVKFSPTGNGANDKAAQFYADKMREIEYRSHAHIAYTTAFENAVQRSYGYVRVKTDYSSPRSDEQELWIEAMPNPDMVLPDPEGLRPDLSDIQYLFNFETWKQAEFKRKFPKAKITDFSKYMAEAPLWVKADDLVLAEYWKIKTKPRKLLLVQGPDGQAAKVFEDELAQMPGAQVVRELRTVDYPEVHQCLTNGLEILEETAWQGKYIPFAACFGKILYLDEGAGSSREILSMTRLARKPYMLYCYYRTCQAEVVGGIPKFPYFVYEDQLDPNELLNLAKSVHEPIAVVRVKATIEGLPSGTVLPFPQRNPYTGEALQYLELGAEAARRAIQAAMGTNFLPTQAQRRNEKSGKALERIEESAQKGSFHFNDHYNDMIRHVGVICEDLMDKIYDTPREVGIQEANEKASMVAINSPEGISTKGDYVVTVSTGPASDSQREIANEFSDALIQSPVVAQIVGPEKASKLLALGIKLKNIGPLGDEMAKVIDPTLDQQGGEMDPAMLQQQLAEAQAKLKQLEQIANEMKQIIETERVKSETELKKADMDNQTKVKIAEVQAAVQQEANHLKIVLEQVKARLHQVEMALEHRHEKNMQDDEQQHEKQLAVHQAREAEAHARFQADNDAQARSEEQQADA